jgi:hypothetical protein
MTNRHTTAAAEAGPDTLVPDPQVCQEFGGITLKCLYDWTRDPALDFPAPIKVKNRNYRSRKALEAFKERMTQQAIRNRNRPAEGRADRPTIRRPRATARLQSTAPNRRSS